MGIERVSQINAFEHRIIMAEPVFDAGRCSQANMLGINVCDACLIRIEQSAFVIAIGPADFITGINIKMLLFIESNLVFRCIGAKFADLKAPLPAPVIFQYKLLWAFIDRDDIILPFAKALTSVRSFKFNHHARFVAVNIAQFFAGAVDPGESFQFESAFAELTVLFKPGLDRFIDGGAQRPTRSINGRGLPFVRREREPAFGSDQGAALFGFDNMVLQIGHGLADISGLG